MDSPIAFRTEWGFFDGLKIIPKIRVGLGHSLDSIQMTILQDQLGRVFVF
jgi:hypothetical protein